MAESQTLAFPTGGEKEWRHVETGGSVKVLAVLPVFGGPVGFEHCPVRFVVLERGTSGTVPLYVDYGYDFYHLIRSDARRAAAALLAAEYNASGWSRGLRVARPSRHREAPPMAAVVR